MDNHLIVGDLHLPYHNDRAISFIERVLKDYKIPKDNIISVGDFFDMYNMSFHDKSPQAEGPHAEYLSALACAKEFYEKFPKIRICESNHEVRLFRKFEKALIPSAFMKAWHDIWEMPREWKYASHWKIATRKPFIVQHGTGYAGQVGHIKAAVNNGISTAIGHLHSFAGVNYFNTTGRGTIWAMNAGCLIDEDALAFAYGKDHPNKPCIGLGVVLDSGMRSEWIPIDA